MLVITQSQQLHCCEDATYVHLHVDIYVRTGPVKICMRIHRQLYTHVFRGLRPEAGNGTAVRPIAKLGLWPAAAM